MFEKPMDSGKIDIIEFGKSIHLCTVDFQIFFQCADKER